MDWAAGRGGRRSSAGWGQRAKMVPITNMGPAIHSHIARGLMLIRSNTLSSLRKSLGITYRSSARWSECPP